MNHIDLVNYYYSRDKDMNINNNTTIIKALKKLKYYNIDVNNELRHSNIEKLVNKISNELNNNFESSILNKTIQELMINEPDPSLNFRLIRSVELNNYINKEDTLDFYNNLSCDELEYLGY